VQWTESDVAAALIQNWDEAVARFIKVMPRDYKRVLSERGAQDRTAQSSAEYKNAPQHQTG
jgi:glutamate synthase domain-containing protein 3